MSDMLYMQSTNSNDGSMSLQVTFGVGSNPDMNTIYTQNRVASATPQLPAAVITQGVTTQKTTTSYIMVLSLFSADGRYDETFLSNYTMLNIKDRIARINAWARYRYSAAARTRCGYGSNPTRWIIWPVGRRYRRGDYLAERSRSRRPARRRTDRRKTGFHLYGPDAFALQYGRQIRQQ